MVNLTYQKSPVGVQRTQICFFICPFHKVLLQSAANMASSLILHFRSSHGGHLSCTVPAPLQSAADVASSLITTAFSAGLPLVSFAIHTALLAERATLSVSSP